MPGETFVQWKGHFQITLQRQKFSDTIPKEKAAIAEHVEVGGRSELFDLVSVDCNLRQKVTTEVGTDIDKALNVT